eukprot:3785091-Rhodomonas_salina.5
MMLLDIVLQAIALISLRKSQTCCTVGPVERVGNFPDFFPWLPYASIVGVKFHPILFYFLHASRPAHLIWLAEIPLAMTLLGRRTHVTVRAVCARGVTFSLISRSVSSPRRSLRRNLEKPD